MTQATLRPRTRQHRVRPLPSVPESFDGSDAEYYVLIALKKHGLLEGVDFIFAARPNLNYVVTGDFIPDFRLPGLRIIIQVQSAYYHSRTGTQRAKDRFALLAFSQRGYRVTYITEDQAALDAYYFVGRALDGFTEGPLSILA